MTSPDSPAARTIAVVTMDRILTDRLPRRPAPTSRLLPAYHLGRWWASLIQFERTGWGRRK